VKQWAYLFAMGLAIAQGRAANAAAGSAAAVATLSASREPTWAAKAADPGMKLSLLAPWSNTTAKFLVPGSSGSPAVKSRIVEVPARLGVYGMAHPADGRAVSMRFEVLALDDPYSKKTCIIFSDGPYPSASDPGLAKFYISDNTGLKLYSIFMDLFWQESFVELPTAPGSMDAAIARFETQFDWEKLTELERTMIFNNSIGLSPATSEDYFSDYPSPGNAIVGAKIEAVDLTDGVLRVDMRNPVTKIPAVFWIDLNAKKITESVVDGREMDLTTGEAFAVPLSGIAPVVHKARLTFADLKPSLKAPWQDLTIRLVVPGSPGPDSTPSRTEEVKARAAAYQFTPKPAPEQGLQIADIFVLAIADPHTQKTAIIAESPFGSQAEDQQAFYVSDRSTMTCFGVQGGWLRWQNSYLEMPASAGPPDAAIAQFEVEYNGERFAREERQNAEKDNVVQIQPALPEFFFSSDPVRSAQLKGTMAAQRLEAPILIESADLTAGILRLDLRNSVTNKTATLWVDLQAKKVTKSIVDGQEMDLATGAPFAVPNSSRKSSAANAAAQ
jgi:hypothetical protein